MAADMENMNEGDEYALPDEGGGFRLVLFIVVPLVLLAAIGTALYITGVFDGFMEDDLDCESVLVGDEQYDACLEAGLISGPGDQPGVFLDIPDLIVNLNSTSRQPRFLKVSVKLEVPDEDELAKVEAIMPRVVDHFQTYLRELRVEDLRGSAGIYRLRNELLSRVNAAAPNIKVDDVLFQEILIQ